MDLAKPLFDKPLLRIMDKTTLLLRQGRFLLCMAGLIGIAIFSNSSASQTTKKYAQGKVLYLIPESCERSSSISYKNKPLPVITNQIGKCRALLPIPLNAKKFLVFNFKDKLAKIEVSNIQAGTSNITISDRTYTEMDQASIDRINKEQKWINSVRQALSPLPNISLPARLPAVGIASTPFGFQRFVNGALSSTHKGLDIANDSGTAIVSPFNGIVSLAVELFYTGNTVMINHGQGIISLFGHLDTIQATEGTQITAGELIGTMGTTGRSTGPHLHWGITILGEHIDPAQFLSPNNRRDIQLAQ